MTHLFLNALSGNVLWIYQGSPTESIEARAEAAGINLKKKAGNSSMPSSRRQKEFGIIGAIKGKVYKNGTYTYFA